MKKTYENININMLDPNVVGEFRMRQLEDGSIRLVRFENESAPTVNFKKSYNGYNNEQRFELVVPRENRLVDGMIIILRSSHNCYIVVGSDLKKSVYERLSSIKDVNEFIKNNFCRTLLSE